MLEQYEVHTSCGDFIFIIYLVRHFIISRVGKTYQLSKSSIRYHSKLNW